MHRKRVTTIIVGALLLAVCRPAAAYNFDTHSRIVESAVGIMQQPPAGSATPPAGVSAADWAAFVSLVSGSRAKLGLLRTGLPNSLPTGGLSAFPTAGAPPSEDFPWAEGAKNCSFDPRHNLDIAGSFQLKDFPYRPFPNADPCGLELANEDVALREVLGWHSGTVDNHLTDTVLWFRPTNMSFFGWFKEGARRAYESLAGAFLLPFACAANLLSGGSCDLNSGRDLANQFNPFDYLDSWLPGFGDVRGDTYTGLWHFMHVDAAGGRYNNPRGMLYEGAGANNPGAIDIAIMAGADLSGLSLNPGQSRGDDQYGQYDSRSRGDGPWQARTIGHLEWSSVDNLARFGWDRYVSGGFTSAAGLGWPLHAIGDVAEPHHVVGTTSFGHRPYEDFVSEHLNEILRSADDAQRLRIMQEARTWWQRFNDDGIQSFVEQLARATREAARPDGDWAYRDGLSVEYLTGVLKAHAIDGYSDAKTRMTGVIETGVAATLGFLVAAAERAQDPGPGTGTLCLPGTHYEIRKGCVNDPRPATPIPSSAADAGFCATNPAACVIIPIDGGSSSDAGCVQACQTVSDCVGAARCVAGCCIQEPR